MTRFQLNCDRLLAVELQNEKVLAIAGSAIAREGQIKFEKALLGGEGLLGVLKRQVTKEKFELMLARGSGTVYFARQAKEISILPLNGEKMFVESSSILAFDEALKSNVAFAGLRGATSGQGLFTTSIEGRGNVAVISEGSLLTLEVSPTYPLFIDPDAFIGYQGNLRQEFVFDVNWKTMVGDTSGETYQLKFTGNGLVYIQPSERK
jgi:uncharacterized protein (AIM24 family)